MFAGSWIRLLLTNSTAWKVSKCGVFCGPYFPVFGLNTPYTLDTFHAVFCTVISNTKYVTSSFKLLSKVTGKHHSKSNSFSGINLSEKTLNNCKLNYTLQKQSFADFFEKVVLKNFAIFTGK